MWDKAYTWGWVAILSILAAYEFYALIWGHGGDQPLTHVTVRYVPSWVTLPLLGWLFLHFLVRYMNPVYVAILKSGGNP